MQDRTPTPFPMPTAYLTVDDAPSAELPRKLAVLEARDVPALFFCEGRRLAEHPDHARRAVEAGFHLGNHTYAHRRASDLSVEEFRDELDRTESLLDDVYDRASATRPARVFRFPYGDTGGDRGERFQRMLADGGFVPPDLTRIGDDRYRERRGDDRDWYWTVDVEDWTADSASELRDRVEAAADRLKDASNDIVLFHDSGNTIEQFEAFVDQFLENGVAFADPLDLVD
ncbi:MULTISPECIES: polysaccharide deacetylase family protein [Halorussus]|uniref:polysaccharide deacetylase family protein n=1 Tax=Halorussus TaxID=1070314 RepID=UPI0020A202FF|nr:polysaccharide deacetylase family protein [Halorussus vallis]USZ77138.1 polysaccharide deacetylase family protein [Halorussus vallis]